MGHHFSATFGFQDFCSGQQDQSPPVRHCGFLPSVEDLGASGWGMAKAKVGHQGPC